MRELMIRLLVPAAVVLVTVAAISVALSHPTVQVAPAKPAPPATFTITGTCTVTATHDGQTVTHLLDGQTTVELAVPGAITAPGCTIQ